jgi:hypothetical protein
MLYDKTSLLLSRWISKSKKPRRPSIRIVKMKTSRILMAMATASAVPTPASTMRTVQAASPVPIPNGALIGNRVIIRTVTDKKLASRKLRGVPKAS